MMCSSFKPCILLVCDSIKHKKNSIYCAEQHTTFIIFQKCFFCFTKALQTIKGGKEMVLSIWLCGKPEIVLFVSLKRTL